MAKKGFLRKALVLSLVLTMLMSVSAFADTNTTSSGTETITVYGGDFDGNPIYLYVNLDYSVDYGWDEGYASWVNQGYISINYITSNLSGGYLDSSDGTGWLNPSSYNKRFSINDVGSIVIQIGVDEWGSVDVYGWHE